MMHFAPTLYPELNYRLKLRGLSRLAKFELIKLMPIACEVRRKF
jgi:hypothetical protein